MKEDFINKVKQYIDENNLADTNLLEKANVITQLTIPEQLTEKYAEEFCENREIWEVTPLFEIVLADNWANELINAKTEEVRDQITAEIASYVDNVPAEHLLMLSEDISKGTSSSSLIRDYIVMLLSGSEALHIIEQSKATLIESMSAMAAIYKERLAK